MVPGCSTFFSNEAQILSFFSLSPPRGSRPRLGKMWKFAATMWQRVYSPFSPVAHTNIHVYIYIWTGRAYTHHCWDLSFALFRGRFAKGRRRYNKRISRRSAGYSQTGNATRSSLFREGEGRGWIKTARRGSPSKGEGKRDSAGANRDSASSRYLGFVTSRSGEREVNPLWE